MESRFLLPVFFNKLLIYSINAFIFESSANISHHKAQFMHLCHSYYTQINVPLNDDANKLGKHLRMREGKVV